MHISVDRGTRVVIELHEDGYLTAELYRVYNEEWTKFAEASQPGSDGSILLEPKP